MGGATFVGTLLPALPYLLGTRTVATILSVFVAMGAIIVISELRIRLDRVNDVAIAIFGSFDGLVCSLGIVAPILAAGLPTKNLLTTAFGLAVAGGLSMGAGQYLEEVYGIKRWAAYIQTAILLILAIVLSAGVGILFNAVG